MIQYACLGHCIFGAMFAALVRQHWGGVIYLTKMVV